MFPGDETDDEDIESLRIDEQEEYKPPDPGSLEEEQQQADDDEDDNDVIEDDKISTKNFQFKVEKETEEEEPFQNDKYADRNGRKPSAATNIANFQVCLRDWSTPKQL